MLRVNPNEDFTLRVITRKKLRVLRTKVLGRCVELPPHPAPLERAQVRGAGEERERGAAIGSRRKPTNTAGYGKQWRIGEREEENNGRWGGVG